MSASGGNCKGDCKGLQGISGLGDTTVATTRESKAELGSLRLVKRRLRGIRHRSFKVQAC